METYLVNKPGDEVEQAVADALHQSLLDLGFNSPSEAAMCEHAKIVEVEGGLDYYWDDILLLSTRPLQTVGCSGLRIFTNE